MSGYITIDGTEYKVPIIKLEQSADFLYKYAERTVDGILHSEMIGVYYNYQIVFASGTNTKEYKNLFSKLTEPVEFHTVKLVDEDGEHTFVAYFAGIKSTYVKVKGSTRYIKGLSVDVIAREPARK